MKHERAIVIALSYVLGFTAAFIGYGFAPTADYSPVIAEVPLAESQSASVVAATPVATPKTVEYDAEMYLEADGLFVEIDGTSRLIAAFSATNPNLGDAAYAEILDPQLSPSKQFVFFCGVSTADSEKCTPLIYSWDTNTLYKVSQNGSVVQSLTTDFRAAWSSGGRLQIDRMISADSLSPWVME